MGAGIGHPGRRWCMSSVRLTRIKHRSVAVRCVMGPLRTLFGGECWRGQRDKLGEADR